MNKVPISTQASVQTIEVGTTTGLPKNTINALVQDEQFLAKNVAITDSQVQMEVLQDGRWQTLRLSLAPPKPKPAVLNEAMVSVSEDGKTLTFTAAPKSVVISDTKQLLMLYSQLMHGAGQLPKQTPVVLKDAQTLAFPKLNMEFHVDKQTMALLRQEPKLIALIEPAKEGIKIVIVSPYSDPLVKVDIAKKMLVNAVAQQLPDVQLRGATDELQLKYVKRGIPTQVSLELNSASQFLPANKWTQATLKSFGDKLSLNTNKQEFSALLQHSIKQHLPNITKQTEQQAATQSTLLNYQTNKLPSIQELKQAVSHAIEKWITTPFAALRQTSNYGQVQKVNEAVTQSAPQTITNPKINASIWLSEPLMLNPSKEASVASNAVPRLFEQIRIIGQQLGKDTIEPARIANQIDATKSRATQFEKLATNPMLHTANLVSAQPAINKSIIARTPNIESSANQNPGPKQPTDTKLDLDIDPVMPKASAPAKSLIANQGYQFTPKATQSLTQHANKQAVQALSSTSMPEQEPLVSNPVSENRILPKSASPIAIDKQPQVSALQTEKYQKGLDNSVNPSLKDTQTRDKNTDVAINSLQQSVKSSAWEQTQPSTKPTESASDKPVHKVPPTQSSNTKIASNPNVHIEKALDSNNIKSVSQDNKAEAITTTAPIQSNSVQAAPNNKQPQAWHAPLLADTELSLTSIKPGKIERLLLGLNQEETTVDKALSLSQSLNDIKTSAKTLPIDLQRLVNQAFDRMWDEKNVHPIAVQQHVSAMTTANVSASPFLQALDKIIVTFLAGAKLSTSMPEGVSSEQRLQSVLNTIYPNQKPSNMQQLLATLTQSAALDSLTSELSKVQTQFQHVSSNQLNAQQSSEHNWLLNLFLPTKNTAEQRQTELQIGKYKKPAKAHLPEKTVWFVRLNFDLAPHGTLSAQAELMDKAVDCSLVAQNSTVLSLAKPHLTALRERLAAHGLQVGEINLSENPEQIAQFYSSHAIVNVRV